MTNPAPASLVEKFKELGFDWEEYCTVLPDTDWTGIKVKEQFHTLDQLRDWLWKSKYKIYCQVSIAIDGTFFWTLFEEYPRERKLKTFLSIEIPKKYFDEEYLALTDALGKAYEILKERKKP